MAGVEISGYLHADGRSVLTVLEVEARKAVYAAAKLEAEAINRAAPKGATGRLERSHKPRTRRQAFGVVGYVRRDPRAWYGRIVEGGRKPGRGYGGAPPHPFSLRAGEAVAAACMELIEQGARRASLIIEERM